MKSNKKILLIALAIAVVLILLVCAVRFLSSEDSYICKDGQWIKHGNPAGLEKTGACSGLDYIPAGIGMFIALIVIVGLWEAVWKIIGLWRCGRNNQLVWFIVIALVNTAGILPLVYLLFYQKKGGRR